MGRETHFCKRAFTPLSTRQDFRSRRAKINRQVAYSSAGQTCALSQRMGAREQPAHDLERKHDYKQEDLPLLSGNVALAQNLESLAHQDGRSALRIVHVQSERGKPARTCKQRISEMHVHLSHEQRREQFHQLGRDLSHFYHDHFANAESHVVFSEQLFHPFRVAHYNPCDGGVGGL